MSVQSLSVVVPNKRCINNCSFCVSRMHCDQSKNQMDDNKPFYDLYLKDYLKRLAYCKEKGIDTIMLTGDSEPQQNRNFLTYFGLFMQLMGQPFRKIEMQTTGVLIDRNYLRFLRNHVGVNTIALSLSSFDSDLNMWYNGTPREFRVDIPWLCSQIKEYDFNLRLCVNMTDGYDWQDIDGIFHMTHYLGADQMTFRVLYTSDEDTPQSRWIKEHGTPPEVKDAVEQYVKEHGKPIDVLPYGAIKYSVDGISTVIDADCMNKSEKDDNKYYILRPDCHLYSQWDDPASLIF